MKVIERITEHYDVWEVEGGLGRAYKWRPEMVVVECDCGRRSTHKRAELIVEGFDCECGRDNAASIREEVVIGLLEEDYESRHHPWRYWHPPKDAGVPF